MKNADVKEEKPNDTNNNSGTVKSIIDSLRMFIRNRDEGAASE